ncbi:nucleotidyltransferase family protein [Erythrobacter sp. Alg231-14]|uniref:nucleotidyltransferase family protein n=1 Tax=Erythrobacter sp. Alg231-14 TaxID=1922225 RepID=UPI00307C45A1
MMDTSSIDGFLAETVRGLRGGVPPVWPSGETVDWRAVWSRIDYHGVPLLLHSSKDRLVGWPDALLDRIVEEARLIVLWETTHRDAVTKILTALHEAGIDAIVMKGTALAYSFHNDPAIRRRGDTDLLVRPRDQERTRAIFRDLGWYKRDDPHGLYHQEGWLHDAAGFFVHSIDLHWEPTDKPVLHNVLPIDGFFDRKHAVSRLGVGAFRPDVAIMLVHATTNQKWHAQHGYDAEDGRLTGPRRLLWSVDFDLLVQNMAIDDWERLISHCSRVKIGPLVAEALIGAAADLGTVLPDDAMAILRGGELDPGIQTYFTDPDSLSQFWLDLNSTPGAAKKIQLIMHRAFAPRDHLLEKYPSAKGWPTLLLQGRMWVETIGRLIRRKGAE